MSVKQQRKVVLALGITQILAWGGSYYLPAVLAEPIAADTGWPLSFIVGGLSLGLTVSGLTAPRVGRIIDLTGGRPVLAASSLALAAGLIMLGLAQNLATYLCAWILLGFGMGTGLYNAAFAALGRLYGEDARRAITNLTLLGGFASTVSWPLTAFLTESVGWRGACLAQAGLQLAVCLPIHLLLLPRFPPSSAVAAKPAPVRDGMADRKDAPAHRSVRFLLLAGALTLGAGISALLSAHLLVLLQAQGLALAGAVALGTLLGPAQVGGRIIQKLFAEQRHPIWTLIASAGLTVAGIALMLSPQGQVLAAAVVLYGAGTGIRSIVQGTLPLALFGGERYGHLMGQLALPMMLASAAAPALGGVLIDRFGATATFAWLIGLTLIGLFCALALLAVIQRRPTSA